MAHLAEPSTPNAAASDAMIEVRGLSKLYNGVAALSDVTLSVGKGEFVTLLGPSGSGKSTLLNLISGMTTPTAGKILINGTDATTLPTNQRGLGMVFQNYALMPHMTVFQNIAFPLQVRKIGKDEIRQRVMDVLKLIQLEHVADRRPRELSGGQQQRISLARCIVYNPPLILMDEPLGALDKKLREGMQLEIKRLHADLGVTMLYVTHDQDEALTMSDRIVLMRGGKIEQQGTPEALYFKPQTVFSADFIGSSNLFPGKLSKDKGGLMLRCAAGAFDVPAADGAFVAGSAAVLLVRPENIMVETPADASGRQQIAATLKDTVVLGGIVRHFLETPAGEQIIAQELNQPNRARLMRGDAVKVSWRVDDGRLLPAERA
ncbi:ABC transporter ATP-binding protein [Mesorhizobium sp. YC-39]|uniref:ABC transporter ATP-binding protein n=1 Tax=unclassified Mesorhizobium TaxID=325217 RepID=UPI0021E953AA|nr:MULTISPECIES: ABC transporter ATP-binding protein [unclassified Mesorhizobium]MCV3210838.1 ABC transporter ATP-binding protein [Mesorhizobium sp. YC-2]MCV3231072.1 ABC transporter ATP-binding protein [Mesorhizobium sp. YC-39]